MVKYKKQELNYINKQKNLKRQKYLESVKEKIDKKKQDEQVLRKKDNKIYDVIRKKRLKDFYEYKEREREKWILHQQTLKR